MNWFTYMINILSTTLALLGVYFCYGEAIRKRNMA